MTDPPLSFYSQYPPGPQQYEHVFQNSQYSQGNQTQQLSQSQNAFTVSYAPRLQPPNSYQFQQTFPVTYAPQFQVVPPDSQIPVNPLPTKYSKSRKNAKGGQNGRTRNFTPKEDEALVRAWLAISGDGIVGNSQPGSTLWSRIYNTFNEILGIKNPDDDLNRSPNSLACRWTTIQHQVNKFCGYFAIVERNPQSGSNFDKWVADAKISFRACEKSDFKMDELWKILRDNPKWNEKNVAPKRKQNLEPTTDIDDINLDSSPESTIIGNGSSTQQEDDSTHVAPNTIENGSERPKFGRKKAKQIKKLGTTADG